MTHILADWIANLKSIRYDDLEAYVIENWSLLGECDIKDPESWSDYEVRLARILYGRDEEKWAEFLEDYEIEHVQETDTWNCSLDLLLHGCKTLLAKPKVLFSVEFDYESDSPAGSWSGGWEATAFTERLGLVSEFGEDDSLSLYIPIPMGLASRGNLFQSIALLFQNCKKRWKSGVDWFARDDFYKSIYVDGIDVPELYRLFLAYEGRGKDAILKMDSKDIVNYREDDMQHDYKNVLKVTNKSK